MTCTKTVIVGEGGEVGMLLTVTCTKTVIVGGEVGMLSIASNGLPYRPLFKEIFMDSRNKENNILVFVEISN